MSKKNIIENTGKKKINFEEQLENFFASYPKLESERLLLRNFITTDYRDLNDILTDPNNFKYTNKGTSLKSDIVKLTLSNYLNIKYIKAMGIINYAIVLKKEKKLIGQIYLKVNNGMPVAEISYIMNTNYQNKGYMKEAIFLLVRFTFQNLNIKRINASPLKDNIASIKVLESINMKLEGIKKKNYYINNKAYDECIYGLLNEEFHYK